MYGRRAERAEAAEKSPALVHEATQGGRFFGGFGSGRGALLHERKKRKRARRARRDGPS